MYIYLSIHIAYITTIQQWNVTEVSTHLIHLSFTCLEERMVSPHQTFTNSSNMDFKLTLHIHIYNDHIKIFRFTLIKSPGFLWLCISSLPPEINHVRLTTHYAFKYAEI